MKKIITNVERFPNDGQAIRFIACFVSMLMRAEGLTGAKIHRELYNLYSVVSGFGFLQDASSLDDQQESNVLLRKFDWYIGFTMDYAGYESEELIFPQDNKDLLLSRIKASIDNDVPVLALFGVLYQWVLITGYDDDGILYGLDGSQGWGKPVPEPAGYDENGLFVIPDWYEKRGHAFILGEKKAPAVTMQEVFERGIRILKYTKPARRSKRLKDFLG